ncbi:sulfonate ABC transporter substrate-binding protein [Paenibacillus apiarius]|uniref:sulfonate ABC transporter substrate-binding protein n=1 Tax=Paenibacillus apiarius TaxID=46240 RepID=UPI00197D09C5|nr:sulfonate ABC transporter substrate-binding protein [Paenibacillus apiarius]MBN3524395.1 sulfonate ABC transporter substrate-binding protein [Paenibacillus apiarius]
MAKNQLDLSDNYKYRSVNVRTRSKRKRLWKAGAIGTWLLLMALAAGCASGAAGSAGGTDASPATPAKAGGAGGTGKVIRIGYQKGNTLNILKVKGNLDARLKAEGYEVEWKVFAGGNFVLEAMSSGSVDFGHAADGSGVFGQAGNKPFVYVANDLPNPEGMGIMVHADSGIHSIAELKGKKIAVSKGGNHHYLAVLALEKAGLKLDDVQFVYVKDASEGRALFETKQIDALGSWDPFFASAENDLKPLTLTDGQGYSPNRTFYYANEQFAKAHPELIRLILEEIQEADEWANDHKPEIVKLLSVALGIDADAIERAVGRRKYGVELLSPEIIAPQQQLADTYHRIGLIPNPIQVAERMPVDAPWAADSATRNK